MRRFEGRTVLVVGGGAEPGGGTGAAAGNGQAIAERLAAEGATVVVSDRDEERARTTVDGLEDRRGHVLVADATDRAASAGLFARAEDVAGPVHAVVLNVGVTGALPGRTQTLEEWDLVQEVNVTSHWLVAQAALAPMTARGGGALVFVTSIAGLIASGSSLSYEASKASLLAVSRHFGTRYAERGIRANALALGVIDSGMVRRAYGDDPDLERARDLMQPLGRQGLPHEAAAAAAFLASDDASFVTGQLLVVDGGRLADGRYDARYARAARARA